MLEVQPNTWTCLPTALSMLINKYRPPHKVQSIFTYLKHDGGLIVNPDLQVPYGCQGFELRELQDYCYFTHDMILTMIDFVDSSDSKNQEYLRENDCVIVGEFWGKSHAGFYDCSKDTIYDPTGTCYVYNQIKNHIMIEGILLVCQRN